MKQTCKRIAIANSKGGVGKTTTTLECAAHAGDMGYKTLVVDMDPQGDSSQTLLGRSLQSNEAHIFHLLIEESELEDVVREANSNWPNVHVIPADLKLTTLPDHLSGILGYERRLSDILDQIEELYDLILIDTGPQTTMLTQIALRASNHLLITTDTSKYAERAIKKTLGIVEQLEKYANYTITNFNVICTATHKPGAKSNLSAKRSLKETYGNKFLTEDLPHCIKVQDGQQKSDKGQSVPAMSLLEKDHPLYMNYRKITNKFIGV